MALGASGAVNAIVMFTAAVYPRNMFYLFIVVPCPAFVFAGLYIAYDLYGAWEGTGRTGALCGACPIAARVGLSGLQLD